MKLAEVGSFCCEICKMDIPARVYTDNPDISDHKEEVVNWVKHYHWINNHRLCAICGKLVHSGELEVAVNDGRILINKNYNHYYEKIKTGDSFGPLLTVHPKCVVS